MFGKRLVLASFLIFGQALSPLNICTSGFCQTIRTSELASYRRDAINKIVSACSVVPNYKSAIIFVAINAIGSVNKCEIVTTSGDKTQDDRIIAAVKALKFPQMSWSGSAQNEMTMQIPLLHGAPNADGLIVGVNESFSYKGDGSSIEMGPANRSLSPSPSQIEAGHLISDVKAAREKRSKDRLDSLEQKLDELSKDRDSEDYMATQLELALLLAPEAQDRAKSIFTEALNRYEKQSKDSTRVDNLLTSCAERWLWGSTQFIDFALAKHTLEVVEQKAPEKPSPFQMRYVNQIYFRARDDAQREQASEILRSLVQIRQTKVGKDDPSVEPYLRQLATLAERSQKYKESEDLNKQILAIKEKQYGKDSAETANQLFVLATSCVKNQDFDAASSYVNRGTAISKLDKSTGISSRDLGRQLAAVGGAYLGAGKLDDASRTIEQAMNIQPNISHTLPSEVNQFATTCRTKGEFQRGKTFLESVLKIEETRWGVDSLQTNAARMLLSGYLLEQIQQARSREEMMKLFHESQKLFEISAKSYTKIEGPQGRTLRSEVRRRIGLLKVGGLPEEARKLESEYHFEQSAPGFYIDSNVRMLPMIPTGSGNPPMSKARGGGTVVAMNTQQTARVDSGANMADITRRIKRQWFPPKGCESKRIVIAFKIHPDGQLSNLRLVTSSGVSIADKAALSAVENAAPFRQHVGPDETDITFTFDYDLFSGARRN